MSDKMVVLFMFLILEMLWMFAVRYSRLCVYVCVCVSSPMRNSSTEAKRMLRCLVLTRTELRKWSDRRLCNQYYFKNTIGNW